MRMTLTSGDGRQIEPDWPTIDRFLDGAQMFWLDIMEPSDDTIDELGRRLHLHPLAIEDSKAFDQRSRVEIYDEHALLIGFGLGDDGELVEVHSYYGTDFLVTLHHRPAPFLETLAQSDGFARALGGDPVIVLYQVASGVASSYEDAFDQIEHRLDQLETEILRNPEAGQLQEISEINERVADIRRAVAPSRSILGGGHSVAVGTLPGMTPEGLRYIADYFDQVERRAADIEGLREHIKAVRDLHVSITSNRQNEVMRQLAFVATIFLPLTFLTGFFGQNFATLINLQSHDGTFLVFGIGLELVSVAVLLLWLGRRGWR